MIEITFTDGRAPLKIEAETMMEAVEKALEYGEFLNYAYLGGKCLRNAYLRNVYLRGANLTGANLSRANLYGATMRDADLTDTNLNGANLTDANLRGANLTDANLTDADLSGANLRGANLRGANIDYSCWPLWCGSLDVKIDKRIFCQLLYHTVRAGQSVEDEEVQALLKNPNVLALANQFHHVDECGRIVGEESEKVES